MTAQWIFLTLFSWKNPLTVLGPLLFFVYIIMISPWQWNHHYHILQMILFSKLSKKLADSHILQNDLDNLVLWENYCCMNAQRTPLCIYTYLYANGPLGAWLSIFSDWTGLMIRWKTMGDKSESESGTAWKRFEKEMFWLWVFSRSENDLKKQGVYILNIYSESENESV